MVPIKCGICSHKQLWKCNGGPRLKDLTCGNCGAASFKRDTYTERKQRVITEAQAEDKAANAPPPLPSEHQISYCTMKALERMAAALEDLRAAALEAGYGRAMLTGERRKPEPAPVQAGDHEPAPGRLHVLGDPVRERVKFKPREGDRLDFGGGRSMEVTATSSYALIVAEFTDQGMVESARRREEWQRAVDIAERISEGPETKPEPAQEAPAVLQSAGGAL